MGGRGSFASGGNGIEQFISVAKICGVKVLVSNKKGSQHGLPLEAKTSKMYLKLRSNNEFQELRIYGNDHRVALEIAYHKERNLTEGKSKNVLHYHVYNYSKDGNFTRGKAILLTKEMAIYKKYETILNWFKL